MKSITKASIGYPGPGTYKNEISWKVSNGRFGGGAPRKTFADEAAEKARKSPSPQDHCRRSKKNL